MVSFALLVFGDGANFPIFSFSGASVFTTKPIQRIKPMKHFTFYWLPIIILCAAIFTQSSYPSPAPEVEWPFFDKLLHFLAYAVLGILFFRAYRTMKFGDRRVAVIILSILSAGLYGMSDEIHQYFVPFRDADWLDLAADIAGSVCGVMVYSTFVRLNQLKKNPPLKEV